jgi:putative molybdopterin biosynthesis protein
MHKRDTFIGNLPLEEALSLFLSRATIAPVEEEIPAAESFGRVTSRPVFARASSPAYTASAMDGVAVRSGDTTSASDANPMELSEGSGFVYVNTGAPLPREFDAVVMIEDVQERPEGAVRLHASAHPWQNVRPVGEDFAEGDLVLPGNRVVRAHDIGSLVASGAMNVSVWRKPRVGVLPTGNEIVRDVSALGEGKILDSNSPMFAALAAEHGALPKVYPVCPDDPQLLAAAVASALAENDLVIVGAGSSAGQRDHTADVIAELGEVLVHGVAIRPGKPAILAVIRGKPVIGAPGYPVSSALVFELFAKPLLLRAQHLPEDPPETLKAFLGRRVTSSFRHEEYVRVQAGHVKGRWIVLPLPRAAGSSITLVRADGVLRVPRESEGIEAGDPVEIRLTRPLRDLEHRLVFAGSHDLALDILADRLPLVSSNVGSTGGLTALLKDECYLAPIHLLDPATGDYNRPWLRRFFPEGGIALIRGFLRCQGFLVRRGNPKCVHGFDDLTRFDIAFLNRQRGSGTRVLLDYELAKRGIDPTEITGYGRELSTHTAVAAGIREGSADTGLAIQAAAAAMGLDFVPACEENYDFALRVDSLDLPEVRRFLEVLRDPAFRRAVESLGGYDASRAGELMEI